jgi:pimeloyl-ACP methyl ester carboxylesterase
MIKVRPSNQLACGRQRPLSTAYQEGVSTMSISDALGEVKEVSLPQGTVRYRERGSGEPIVFVHGLLVNGDLWRKVVPELSKDFRCITPDWPLGSHEVPLSPATDLSPPGVAQLIADFIEAIGLEQVTLVGNDTGGAFCQRVVTRHPERIGRLVLTPCDAYENFPPRLFRFLLYAARVPGVLRMLMEPMRLAPMRRTPLAFGWLSKKGIDDEVTAGWAKPVLSNPGARRDVIKVLKGIDPSYTLEAAKRLREFDRPVLIVWASEKDFFPLEHAERLAKDFPNSQLERVDDSYTFVSEDQPERLTESIRQFARRPAAAAAS